MDRARKDFESADAGLVLIGQLTPKHAAHFRRRRKIDLPVLADNDRASYRAAGAKIGTISELIGPKVVAKGVVTIARTGLFQTRTIGDPAQLGGTIVINPKGEVVWTHMAQDASDNASPDEILAAVRSA